MKSIYYLLLLLIFLFILSCKSLEDNAKVNNNINFNEGWVNENKFISVSIGYPNGYAVTENDIKNSAFNAALELSKVKIENAFSKELPNIENNYLFIKNIVDKYIKIEYSNFIDNRYYQIKSSVEYNDLLNLLRRGNIKKY